MDLKDRAALVRAIRCEIKQEAVYYVARERQRRGRARMDARNQRNREVYGRIGERIDARIDRAAASYRRYENARLRASNQREARRIAESGYDITPRFAARSQAMRNRAESAALRERAGSGSNRWRGTVRQTGADLRASPPVNYDASVRASRGDRGPVIDQDPFSYQPPARRRRNPPGELRTGRPQRRRN